MNYIGMLKEKQLYIDNKQTTKKENQSSNVRKATQ